MPPLYADGFDDAILGVGYRCGNEVIVYDYDQCIAILVDRDGMCGEDAIDFFEFNVVGAWVGETTPIFLKRMDKEEIEDIYSVENDVAGG